MPRAWNQAERKENCLQQNNRALHRLQCLLISDGVKEDPSKVIAIANLTKGPFTQAIFVAATRYNFCRS